MELSAANVNDFLKVMGNKQTGEIILTIEALKSNSASSARKQDALREIGAKLGAEKGDAIGKLLIPKIDAGFNYKTDWKDSCESLSGEWVASKAMLIIRWNGNQIHEGYTRLHSAVIKGDVSWVKNLLTSDEWVETLCSNFSPLHVAQDSNNKEIIALLEDYQNAHTEKKKDLPPPPPYTESERPETTSGGKTVVLTSNLTPAIQSHAIGCAVQALEMFEDKTEAAKYIKNEFEEAYSEVDWHCIISKGGGDEFCYCVAYYYNRYISFVINSFKILLFGTYAPTPFGRLFSYGRPADGLS